MIKVIEEQDHIRIYIKGLLHLHIATAELVGVQSWIERGNKTFAIEYTFSAGAVITSEYSSRATFETILKAMEGVL